MDDLAEALLILAACMLEYLCGLPADEPAVQRRVIE